MNSCVLLATVAAVAPWVANWLTPIWLVGVGTLLGLLVLVVVWLLALGLSRVPGLGGLAEQAQREDAGWLSRCLLPVTGLVSRRTLAEVPLAIREGVLWPLLITCLAVAAFGVVGVAFVQDPLPILRSLGRLPSVGTETSTFEVPRSELENTRDRLSDLVAHVIPVQLMAAEVKELKFRSDQNLTIATRPFLEVKPARPWRSWPMNRPRG